MFRCTDISAILPRSGDADGDSGMYSLVKTQEK